MSPMPNVVEPFRFKGKNHKGAAQLMWEADQRRLAEKKDRKARNKRIAKQSSCGCPAARRARMMKRCQILPGESAKEALDRSLTESGLEMRRWYREVYLQSRHWKDLRARALSEQGCFCQECRQAAKTLDPHHENYRNIFDVEVSDLRILCRSCHDKKHDTSSFFPKVERPGRYRCASEPLGTDLQPLIF